MTKPEISCPPKPSAVDSLPPPKPKGVAALSPERRREIARLGGMATAAQGKLRPFSPEAAREAGSLGGKAAHASGRAYRFTTESSLRALEYRKNPRPVEVGVAPLSPPDDVPSNAA